MRFHLPLHRLQAVAAASAMAMCLASPADAATYTAKQLVLPHDVGHGCAVYGINDSAQLSGGCFTEDDLFSVGFSTQPKGKKGTDFGLLTGTDSFGLGINNSGVVVGEATLEGDEIYHAVLRRPGDAALTDLGTLGGTYAYAAAINDNGQIVGVSSTAASDDRHIFVTSLADPRLVDLGDLGAGEMEANAINSKGIIVGVGSVSVPDAGNTYRGFYAKPPHYKLIQLGTLGGATSVARAINDNGLIVGYSRTEGNNTRAFVADLRQGGQIRDLGTPAGQYSSALNVNNKGQIVGVYKRVDLVSAAFTCSNDCTDFVDLNTVTSNLPPNVLLTSARSINKKGAIVAAGNDKKLYLLTPQK